MGVWKSKRNREKFKMTHFFANPKFFLLQEGERKKTKLLQNTLTRASFFLAEEERHATLKTQTHALLLRAKR